ncbi:hypothetical protein [Microbacterium sp. NIBRBAC000506063]|uniref:hypothetical protein n=1 Tax=Microbacterium sp. NIBRBAC000506063 TaxID=2734618 RepID=UPI001BB4D5CC|nr:hypothetical protein [Microbacterium sp. NIBRBAC000506063]QTV79402.1 hypothetical protein KAE78_10680 [Microbacterium sp. NIBRBAC000506063]
MLSWDEVSKRAAEQLRLGQLQAHGFQGGRVSHGWTERVVFRTGRRFYETLRYQPSPDEGIDVSEAVGEAVVVSVTPFDIESEQGPVIVSDRVLPGRPNDPQKWIDSVIASAIPKKRKRKAGSSPPMPDEAFWAYISVLGGTVTLVG